MHPWKVVLIGALTCLSFGLVMGALLAPMVVTGGNRWAWMGGLLVAGLCSSAVLAAFMRHASSSLDVKTRGARY